MTVAPVQDLVLDVMAAADPASQRVAASKLEKLSPAAAGEFATTVGEKIGTDAQGRNVTTAIDPVRIVRTDNTDRGVFRKFEAFVLQTFVESMLPQGNGEIFGKGTAGMVWRSMLAEHIANEMAKGNGVGIANQLAKTRSAGDDAGNNG